MKDDEPSQAEINIDQKEIDNPPVTTKKGKKTKKTFADVDWLAKVTEALQVC